MSEKPFIVYRSSAGSGKTFTLALVYLRIMLSRSDAAYFRSILALTFTVKAAGEMKERITAYLADIAEGANHRRKETPVIKAGLMQALSIGEEELQQRAQSCLSSILHNYSDFQILTIDKFIARLTRSFSADLALAPDFDIEIDQSLFIEKVIEAMYNEVGSSESTTNLLREFLKFRLARQESSKLEDPLSGTAHAMLSETFFFLQDQIKHYNADELFSLKAKIEARIEGYLEQVHVVGKAAIELIERSGIEPGELAGGRNGIYSFFNKLKEADLKKDLLPTATVQKNIDSDKWKSAKGSDAVYEIKDQLLAYFEQAQALLAYFPAIKTEAALLNEIFTLGFIGELARLSSQVREEENIQLLSDLGQVISSQFPKEQTPFIYERLGSRINHLLVDEFQDTSDLQWHNLLPLFENALSEGKETLIVGDAKQSIYRFRGSEPQLFNALPNVKHSSHALFAESYKEERLGANYRSSKRVVEFNNRFFGKLRQQLDSPLIARSFEGHEQEPFQESGGAVNWWFNRFEKGLKKTKDDVMLRMTDHIAELIRSEACKPEDICCLFRSRADAAMCSSHLISMGFRVISEESLMLQSNPGVQLIITSLRAMREPNDPFLIQTWLARFHHWTGIDSYHEWAKKVKTEKWNLHQLIDNIAPNLPRTVQNNAFAACFGLIKGFNMPLDDPFIRRLLDFALAFEQQNGFLNTTFLDHWSLHQEGLSIQLPKGEAAIRVMTIHKSKGLEFPVTMVFLPSFGKSRNTHENLWVQVSEPANYGVALLKTADLKQSLYHHLYEEEDEKSWLDFINLAYVAFTRAEQQLEIFSNEASPSSNKLGFLKEWPEWDEERYALCFN